MNPSASLAFLVLLVLPLLVFSSVSWPVTGNKTSYCSIASSVLDGSTSFTEALQNVTMRVGMRVLNNYIIRVSSSTLKPYGGFIYDVLTEIESRSGIKFQYVALPSPTVNQTSETYMVEVLGHVDLYADNLYSDTVARRAYGLSFLGAFVESSTVLITKESVNKQKELDIFSFAAPFSGTLWGCLMVAIFLNGVLHWLLETYDPKSKGFAKQFTFLESIYRSIGCFTGTTTSHWQDRWSVSSLRSTSENVLYRVHSLIHSVLLLLLFS
jgi:hypothetical protein